MKRTQRAIFVAWVVWTMFWLYRATLWSGSSHDKICDDDNAFAIAFCKQQSERFWVAGDYVFYLLVIIGIPLGLFLILKVFRWVSEGES